MAERRACTCPPREAVPDRTGLCWRCHGHVEPMEHLASVTEIRQPPTTDASTTAPLEAIALLTALIDDDYDTANTLIEESTDTVRLALMAGCYGAAAWRLWRDSADRRRRRCPAAAGPERSFLLVSDFDPRLHEDGAPGMMTAQLRAQWGDVEFERYVVRVQQGHEAGIRQTDAITGRETARGSFFSALAVAVMLLAATAVYLAVWWSLR
jgi:hypothetical protein